MKRLAMAVAAAMVLGEGAARADDRLGSGGGGRLGPQMPLQRASLWGEASMGQEDLGYRLVRRDGLTAGLSFQASLLALLIGDSQLRGGDLLGFSFGLGGMSSDLTDDSVNYTMTLTAGAQLWYLLDRRVDLGVFGGVRADFVGTAGGAFQPGSRAFFLFGGVGARYNGWGLELSAGEMQYLHAVVHCWFLTPNMPGLEFTHLRQADHVGLENPKGADSIQLFWERQL